ncbi:MAG: PAS domain S-box protein [Gemmatimonadetes bacterium]|nr:PAS domain S-box protein [Gemmatimonadota bacterium]
MAGIEPPVGSMPRLPERDAVLGALFESAPGRTAILDAEGVVVAVNAAWRRAAAEGGWTHPSGGVGASHMEAARFPHEADAATVGAGLSAILAGDSALFTHEYESSAPGGPERWLTVTLYPVEGCDPVRVVAVHVETTDARRTWRALAEARGQQRLILEQAPDGTLAADTERQLRSSEAYFRTLTGATDISDRKAAELALEASEEWSRALIEQSSDLTVVLGPDGRILYASPNRERILGTSPGGVVGRDSSELLLVHPDDRDEAQRLWQEVYGSPGATAQAALRIEHAGGSWRTLECSARNLLDNPAVRGIVVNARDVTDRVQLEHQLQQAQKMEAIGRLAGGVAHDFNNILTGIQGYTQLSLEELPKEHAVRPNLEEVARSADRAAGLTRQLLAFSRRQMMQPRVVDPNETVRELRRMLTRVIGEDVELSTELATDAGCILVDPGQLEQVILNLAVNARDAMPVGGRLTIRTGRVRLSGRDLADAEELEPGEYVELGVSDTGHGMSTQVMERLFEPFFTTKELGKGTGLGLSTVYGIIKQSGGHIRVESFPGGGTTFQVYFPGVVGRPEVSESRPAGVAAMGGETILLVEDDASVRKLAGRILRGRGYRVVEAGNGAEAWSIFRAAADPIDLVLSDVVMPELGGRELVERITAERPGMPVILMSGYTDDVILRHGAREVGAAFLEKPFTPAALVEQVRLTLDGVVAGGVHPADDAQPEI